MFGKFVAFMAATSLAITPALAQSSAAPLSLQPVDRAAADTDGGSRLRGGSWFPPILAATIVILGILTAAGVIFDDDDPPTSP